MAMRNWWIEAEIDGRKHKLTGGPRDKNGGFYLTVRQRHNGASRAALTVWGWISEEDDQLMLMVWDHEGKVWGKLVTPR